MTAATVKGPNATSGARLDTRPRRTTVLDGVDVAANLLRNVWASLVIFCGHFPDVLHAGPVQFRTGWFVESLATQTLIIFAIRTRRVPLFRSRPGLVLTLAAFAVVAVGVTLTAGPPTGVHHTAVAVLHRAGPVHNRRPATRRDDEDGVLGRSDDAPCRSATPHPRPRTPHPPPSRPLQPRQPHRPPAQRAGPVTHVSPRILGARPPSPRDDDPSPCHFPRKVGGGVGRRPCAFVMVSDG